MDKESGEITEQTRIPLQLAGAIAGVLIIVVLWGAKLEFNSARAETRLTKQRTDIDALTGLCQRDIVEVKTDLLVIKCHLKVPDPRCPGRP